MKDGTRESPKFDGLRLRLELDDWEAVGLLEAVWLFTRRQAMNGAIGRWSDEQIARAIGWRRTEPSAMVAALVAERWLDPDAEHRLLVHDWSKHADDGVHLTLARRFEDFADGSPPRPPIAKIHSGEREKILKFLKKKRAKRSASGSATGGAMASPQGSSGAASGSAMVIPAPPRQAQPSPDRAASPNHSAESETLLPPRTGGVAHGNGNGGGNGLRPESGDGSGDRARDTDPADTMAYVLEELERRELEVDRTGQFLIALYEACTRHVRRGEWDYELDQLPLNKHHETGEPATVPFLVAAEINDPASRAEYAEERWAKVHRRFYGDE